MRVQTQLVAKEFRELFATRAFWLLLQLPGSLLTKLTAKSFVLLCAWLLSWLPGVMAIVLWRS